MPRATTSVSVGCLSGGDSRCVVIDEGELKLMCWEPRAWSVERDVRSSAQGSVVFDAEIKMNERRVYEKGRSL